ncbi:MAG: hypothetical protein H7240_02285 [Glaciimonas sp.]|nr:hypothetical protein [Glaciimonas sp.]
MYLIFSLTGMYWTFEWFKDGTNWIVGENQPARQMQPKQTESMQKVVVRRAETSSGDTCRRQISIVPDIGADMTDIFARDRKTNGYSTARLRFPERPGKPVQIIYLDTNPPHERARNQILGNR